MIATYHTAGAANSVSRGLDRDRIVDETGGQTVVFGRRGARPFHLAEMAPFFHRLESGRIYTVEDVKLATRSGAVLTPVPAPAPPIEPTPLPISAPQH